MTDPYLTPEQVKARRPDVLDAFSDEWIARQVAAFEDIAERYRGCAFTDRGQDPDGYPGVVYSAPPEVLLEGCAEFVAARASTVASGTSRNILTQGFEGGGVTRYSTPDWSAGRPTGFLDVDAALNALPDYRLPGIA